VVSTAGRCTHPQGAALICVTVLSLSPLAPIAGFTFFHLLESTLLSRCPLTSAAPRLRGAGDVAHGQQRIPPRRRSSRSSRRPPSQSPPPPPGSTSTPRPRRRRPRLRRDRGDLPRGCGLGTATRRPRGALRGEARFCRLAAAPTRTSWSGLATLFRPHLLWWQPGDGMAVSWRAASPKDYLVVSAPLVQALQHERGPGPYLPLSRIASRNRKRNGRDIYKSRTRGDELP